MFTKEQAEYRIMHGGGVAYRWVKEHKTLNFSTAPHDVRTEIDALMQHGLPCNDHCIYFFDKYLDNNAGNFTSKYKLPMWLHKALPNFKVWNEQPLLIKHIKSVEELRGIDCYDFFLMLSGSHAISAPVSFSELEGIIGHFYVMWEECFRDVNFHTMDGGARREAAVRHIDHRGDVAKAYLIMLTDYPIGEIQSATAEKIFKYCTRSCIEKEPWPRMKEIVDMAPDVPITCGKFTSYKQARQIHDTYVAVENKRLREEWERREKIANTTYQYDPRLVEIIEKFGFYLPKKPKDLITRGADHHNCVATYEERHAFYRDVGGTDGVLPGFKMTRIILTDKGTCELRIFLRDGLIEKVHIGQWKGRFNKDLEQTNEMAQLCLSLIGMPKEILQYGGTV